MTATYEDMYDLLRMELNEESAPIDNLHIRRVPGGWVYTQFFGPDTTSVFVPEPTQ